MDSQQRELQQMMNMELQQQMVQDLIFRVNDTCWEKCASGTGKLTAREADCVKNCSERYLDTTQAVTRKLSEEK